MVYSAFYREDKPGDFNEWVLVREIRNTEFYLNELSLVAEVDQQIVGHILFTPMAIENGNEAHNTIAMAPVSVFKDYQNQGIGTALVEKGIATANDLGYDSIIVMGHPTYYKRFGFKKASEWKIGIDSSFNNDFLFGLELKPNALKNKNGIIRYAPPFYSKTGELI